MKSTIYAKKRGQISSQKLADTTAIDSCYLKFLFEVQLDKVHLTTYTYGVYVYFCPLSTLKSPSSVGVLDRS